MAARYFNWKLAIVLVVAAAVFTVSVFSIHRWQKTTRADQALPQGLKAYEAKKWDEAATQLGRYLAINNQDTEILPKYAEAQLNRVPVTPGNIQLAVSAYRTVLRLKPDDPNSARRLAELYMGMRAPGEAQLIAQRQLERRDDPVLRRLLGEALWQQRHFEEAVKEVQAVTEKYPNEIAAFEFMGAAAEVRPKDVRRPSSEWLDEAIAKNPESALAYAARAAYHLRKNATDQALADLARATACDLSDTKVRYRIVGELISAGAWEKAREQLLAMQPTEGNNPVFWQTWARLAIRTKSPEEMFKVAEDGIGALTAQSTEFLPVAVQLLILSDHLDKVEGYLAQMRSRDKDFEPSKVAYLEGMLYEKRGQLRDAVEAWRRALSLGSKLGDEVHTRLAYVLANLGDVQSAISQVQIMLSQRPPAVDQTQLSLSQRVEYVEGYLLLTRLFAQARNWPKVLEEARRVQEIAQGLAEPTREAALLELQARSHLLAMSTDSAEAKKQAWSGIEARLAELDKPSDGLIGVKLLQVQVAMMQGKHPEATALLDELDAKYPGDLRLMLLRSDLYVVQNKEAEAKACYESIIAKFPQASEPVRGLAILLDRRGQKSECEATIREAFARIREPRPRQDLGLLLAEFYYRWQEKEKLVQWLTDMTVHFPSDIQPRRLLLACEPVSGDPVKSQEIIDEIKTLEGPKGSQWRYEQARLWMRGEGFKLNYPQVVKALQENLLTNPEDQASRLLLAGAYEMAGEQPLALSTYREAFARTPQNTQVLVRLITALHKAGEYDEAQSILDKVALEGRHPDLQRLQVDNDFRRGDLDSASGTLQQLVEMDPNDAELRLSYARVLILRGQFAEADAILTELRAKQPKSIRVAHAQIRLYIQQGNVEKALQVCNDVLEQLHNAAAYLLRAEVHITLKDNAKALEDLGQAISLEPQNADTWEARSRVYSSMGRLAEAISDARQALTLSPQERRVQKLAVALLLATQKESRVREAESILDRVLADSANPQDRAVAELGLLKAQILIRRSTGPSIEEARRRLRQITADHPKLSEGWELMAQLELNQEEPSRALEAATRGLAHNEQSLRLMLLRANAEKRLSPSVAALTTFPALAKEHPNDLGILIEWADAHARAGRPERAVELLSQKLADLSGDERRRCEIALAAALYSDQQREKAKAMFDTLIAAEPNDPTPVMTLGQLLRKEKRWTEVNQLVTLWRNTNPKDAETATNMARILAGSGDREALQMAEDQLRMILEPNPESVPALVLLGMLMQDAERDQEATRLNRRILELDPNNVIAINNLAWILCEQPNASPEVIKEAMALANRGLTIQPEYMDLLDTRGVVFYRSGELEKAVADFLKCLELFPADAPQSAAPRFHLARAYADMNRRTEALQRLKEALELNRKNISLAKDHADAGRRTHAIKVLKDALSLQEQMDQFKKGFDQQDFGVLRSADDWTNATLLLDQLQKGR